jgi:hypothetical protein
MNKIYRVNSGNQIKSIANGLKVLPLVPVALAVGYFGGYTGSFWDPDFATVLFIWNLIIFLPEIILHISYYLTNRVTKLELDGESERLLITDSNGKHQIAPDMVKEVVRVIYKDYRLPQWQQNWQPMPWRNYGYLKLITKDNRVFFFSSLMLDPQHPPMEIKATLFKFIPLLDEGIESFSKSYENNPLNNLDNEFYELDKIERLDDIQIKYIRNNKDQFTN